VVIPDKTQVTNSVWDIDLCSLTITTGGVITLTDLRVFLHYPTKVAGSQLDDKTVNDDKIGFRIPKLTKRQGGSSAAWGNPGTTNFTPFEVKQQIGSVQVSVATGANAGTITITFPEAFGTPPIVIANAASTGAQSESYVVTVRSVSTTTAELHVRDVLQQGLAALVTVNWFAIGGAT
jgi:hypothetical protein